MPFFENRRGLKIYYNDYNPGADKCVVLLHGWGSSVSFFHQQIPMLTDGGFRVVAFDAEGHGRSERANQMTLDDITAKNREYILRDFEDLSAFLRFPKKFYIIGHSLVGGGIAQLFAIKRPERVLGLGLLNTGTLLIDNVIRNVFWNALPTFIRIQYISFVRNPDNLLNVLDKMIPFIHLAIASELEKFLEVPPELDVLIQTEIQEMFSTRIPADQLRVPCIIMGAELDDFAPVELSKELHKKIKNSTLKVIPMAGHFAPAQRSEVVNRYLQDFFSQAGGHVVGS